jgi:CheY-like chemotaxis protein
MPTVLIIDDNDTNREGLAHTVNVCRTTPRVLWTSAAVKQVGLR